MSVRKHFRVVTVAVTPTNNARELRLTKVEGGVRLTAVFSSTKMKVKAVLPWKELWKATFLKDLERCAFKTNLRCIVKSTHFFAEGSRLRLLFTPVGGCDLVCVSTQDLREALLVIK